MSRRLADQSIFRRFPYPLATSWARARTLALSDSERVSYACGALEIFLRYFAAIMVRDYLRGPVDPAVDRRLGDAARLSCGHWLRLSREASRAVLARAGQAPFVPELARALVDGSPLSASLDALVEERNRSFAHSAQPPPGEQARAAKVLLEGLSGVLDQVPSLAEYRLFRVVTEGRTRSGAVRGKVRFLVGQVLENEPRNAAWDGPLVREGLYLASPDGSSALELTPFLSMRLDAATGREALFLWDGTDRDARLLVVRQLDTGREERGAVVEDGTETTFAEWLAARASRPGVVPLGPGAQGFATQLPAGLPAVVLQSVGERFELVEPLGEGGMASVWRVRDRVTGDESALKLLKPGWAEDPQSRDRFVREARTLLDAAHPHVVPVSELLEWGETGLAIRMPVMEGGSLRDLTQGRPQAPGLVRDWLAQALDALAYLHGRGIVHRDVKPQNLLFDGAGVLRLADFGVALRADEVRLTRTRESLGTLGYMAPEQLRGGRVGPAADIHALGVAAHEWLTGQLPEGAAGVGIEGELGAMLAGMTALEPSQRPSANELLAVLGATQSAPPAPAPGAAKARSRPAAGRRSARAAFLVLFVIALGTGTGFAWHADRTSQTHPLRRLLSFSRCGNGRIEPGESCDDANAIDSDACSNACVPNAVFLTGAGPDKNRWLVGSTVPCVDRAACALESPATPVLISPFWLARTETTEEAFVAWAAVAKVPVDDARRARAQRDPRLPAGDVSYGQALAVCEAMGGRLPSEVEWEYAARDGGRDVAYPWGDAPADCDHAILGDHRCSLGRAWQVCSRPLGNSSAGACDLAGNVWEWTTPAFDTPAGSEGVRPYPGLAAAPPGADYVLPGLFPRLEGTRPIRGGGFWHTVPFWTRARARYAMAQEAREANIGFRCAWEAGAFPLPPELAKAQ